MKNSDFCEIYVHIPFCVRKCDYCDFVSFACKESVWEEYFKALYRQIELKAETMGKLPVASCFFGGGTPSVPDAEYICKTLNLLREKFKFSDDAEITIEMNPNSASKEKLAMYKEAGINRISIGLQSTENEELKKLTRLHSYEEFLNTYNTARNLGFENINIDLMSAIPRQTLESYSRTLERVIGLNPEHISAYSLILEEGTPFFERYKDGNDLPNEDIERQMYYLTKEKLAEAGYHRYEISNYSKENRECRHNLGYWRRVPYLGFGIAAASLYENTRYQMHSDLKRFINGDFSEEVENLSKEDCISEFMFLGLRCVSGVSKREFFELFGVNMDDIYAEQLSKLSKENLLVNSSRVFLTERGMDLANYCMSEFIN